MNQRQRHLIAQAVQLLTQALAEDNGQPRRGRITELLQPPPTPDANGRIPLDQVMGPDAERNRRRAALRAKQP